MRNLERKVRCPNAATLIRLQAVAASAGAHFVRTMTQQDTYFVAPRGRLKLREWRVEEMAAESQATSPAFEDGEASPTGAVLVAYARPDLAESRYSDYRLVTIADAAMLLAALTETLGVRCIVAKRRILYRWANTRIHFDEVATLGNFIELETVLEHFPDEDVSTAAAREHQEVITALGLDRLPVQAGSYSDLLMQRALSEGS